MAHTPGPWRVDYRYVIAPENTLIAEVFSRQLAADLKLIAAAPELLDALRDLIQIGKRNLTNPKYDGYFESAAAAIAKAEGRA